MKFKFIFTLFYFTSIMSFAQTENYVGNWVNNKGNRKWIISTVVEGEIVSITDILETDTFAIDDYNGHIENGKIVLDADSIKHKRPYSEIKYSNDTLLYTCRGLFSKDELTTDTFVRDFEYDYKLQEKYLKRINDNFLNTVYTPFFTKRHISFNCENCEAIRMTIQFDLTQSGKIKNNNIEIISESIYCNKLKSTDINTMKQLFLDYYKAQRYDKKLFNHRLKIEIRPKYLLKC